MVSYFIVRKGESAECRFYVNGFVKQLWPYFRAFRANLIFILIIKLSLLVPSLLYPVTYKLFIDNVLADRAIGQLGNVIVLVLGLYLLETMNEYQEETIICISHDASVSNFFSRQLKLTKG